MLRKPTKSTKPIKRKSKVPNPSVSETNRRFEFSRYLLDSLKEFNAKTNKYRRYLTKKEDQTAVDASESIAMLINSLRLLD